MNNQTEIPKGTPVEIYRSKNISLPIYRGNTVKKGKTYTGFRFTYESGGKTHFKGASTLEKARALAAEVAGQMRLGEFAATDPSILLTGKALREYQMLEEARKEVGDLWLFWQSQVLPARKLLSEIGKSSLLDAATFYFNHVRDLRPMSVKWAAKRFLAKKRHDWSKAYFERAKRHLSYLIAEFGHRQVRDMTDRDITNFMGFYPRRVQAEKERRAKAVLAKQQQRLSRQPKPRGRPRTNQPNQNEN